MNWATAGVAVLGAFLGGGAGAILGPSAAWRIERKRERNDVRRARIAEWRSGAVNWSRTLDPWSVGTIPEVEVRDLLAQDWYRSLRSQLPDDTRASIEERPTALVSGTTAQTTVLLSAPGMVEHPRAAAVFAAIDNLERRWDLV